MGMEKYNVYPKSCARNKNTTFITERIILSSLSKKKFPEGYDFTANCDVTFNRDEICIEYEWVIVLEQFKHLFVIQGLFVLFIAAWAIFQLSCGCHHYRWLGCKFRPMLGAQGLWAGRDLYRATPTATRDLGLYGFIRKTDTHVPQWDSNLRLKDHQIFEPDALHVTFISND